VHGDIPDSRDRLTHPAGDDAPAGHDQPQVGQLGVAESARAQPVLLPRRATHFRGRQRARHVFVQVLIICDRESSQTHTSQH